MKTCAICHASQPLDAPTCEHCGEASWHEHDGHGATGNPMRCAKCAELGYRPCSVECFVAAGYKEEEFDSFVTECEARKAAADAKPTVPMTPEELLATAKPEPTQADIEAWADAEAEEIADGLGVPPTGEKAGA